MTEKQYNLRAGYYDEYTGICSDIEENLTTNEVVDLLNEYELLLGKIKKLCNQNRIPNLLTTYIPVNCEKRKSCLDNHMVNASNMGKSNLAKEILKLIGRE